MLGRASGAWEGLLLLVPDCGEIQCEDPRQTLTNPDLGSPCSALRKLYIHMEWSFDKGFDLFRVSTEQLDTPIQETVFALVWSFGRHRSARVLLTCFHAAPRLLILLCRVERVGHCGAASRRMNCGQREGGEQG